MRSVRLLVPILLLGGLLVLAGLALAQEDLWKFMPRGGREMLIDVRARCGNCDDIAAIVTTKRTADEWLRYFTGKQSTLANLSDAEKRKGALATLTEKQMRTLASYMALNLPIPRDKVPRDPQRAQWATILPPDGRVLAMEKCLGCHNIAVTALISADLNGWGVIMRKSDHNNLGLTDAGLQTLLHYLAINMPVPEDSIPAQLRQGGVGY